ncbi:MAG: DEAD/DEAH box helicase [Puniceicoccaceae bacterium]
MTLHSIDIPLTLPDLWQQDAVRQILEGRDVVVDAPTGAGKTYIFEMLVESRKLQGQLIFTVPTRALANDKLLEWRHKGWNVGIATGDITDNLNAPVLVATLETQKARLLQGAQPRLIVIDEYQMIQDPSRGTNYEMTIAVAAPNTQLLLLSGSVQNPADVVDWLRRIGRKAHLISHRERPVPQEQLYLEALPDRAPKSIYGFWPRFLYRALQAELDPILIFAPQRKDAERIARQVAASLPEDDPLELSPEQRNLAGEALAKLLKSRVAFHHSGLSYRQRAGVIEPLAKAGQLRIVVATTGLGAGINFSMRSVIVTERDYRQRDQVSQVRPDELLQMFGRAGRRGLDDRGYVLVLPQKPRLEDAAPITVRRIHQLDWPSFLGLMQQAHQLGQDPRKAALKLAASLFTHSPLPLGFESGSTPLTTPTVHKQLSPAATSHSSALNAKDTLIEILNSQGTWERRRGPHEVQLQHTLSFHRNHWKPSTQVAGTLSRFPHGNTCKIQHKGKRQYAKEWVVAHFPTQSDHHSLLLNKKYRKAAVQAFANTSAKAPSIPKRMDLAQLESHLRKALPLITQGGQLIDLLERNSSVIARVDMAAASITARKDSHGNFLVDPPEREVTRAYENFSLKDHALAGSSRSDASPAKIWLQLGLINARGIPTRRGVLFSYFNHGEGLAVAAALEDADYPIEQLVWDLANLRTGHRFDELGDLGSRLSYVCRESYGSVSHPGYLHRGLPEEYGEGGSELVFNLSKSARWKYEIIGGEISEGDVERVWLEWKSVLRQIANAPEFPWSRWQELQAQARERIQIATTSHNLLDLPALTVRQRSRKPMPFRARRS